MERIDIEKNRSLVGFLEELLKGNLKEFIEWAASPLPPVLRVNTLKSTIGTVVERLERQGFVLEQIKKLPILFRLRHSPVEIGRTLEHFLGFIYIQELASAIPALVLDPRKGERVLDMAAAPGSKTTLMAQLMENTGLIVANDIDYERLRALASNLDRLGVLNVVMTEVDGHKFGFWHEGQFDKVLVDVPCSAIGTLHRAPEILKWWSWEKVHRLTRIQKGLILAGYRALREGGLMVYSTCTLVPQENEAIVDFLLNHYPEAEIVDFEDFGLVWSLGLTEWKHRTYDERVKKTKRLLPFANQTEGFYVAKIRKPLT